MKRRMIAFALLCAMLLCGCGERGNNDQSSQTQQPEQSVTQQVEPIYGYKEKTCEHIFTDDNTGNIYGKILKLQA